MALGQPVDGDIDLLIQGDGEKIIDINTNPKGYFKQLLKRVLNAKFVGLGQFENSTGFNDEPKNVSMSYETKAKVADALRNTSQY